MNVSTTGGTEGGYVISRKLFNLVEISECELPFFSLVRDPDPILCTLMYLIGSPKAKWLDLYSHV